MANDDTDSAVKLTAYGYAGDATPDWNSAHAIGDRDNTLTADPEHQSVALTQAQREAQFGVTGHSTGLPFQYGGKTYYDDDTAPEGDYRIDVFSPNHPPDKLTLSSGHKREATSMLSPDYGKSMLSDDPYQMGQDQYGLEEQSDSFSEPKKTSQLQVGKADDSILSPQKMIAALRASHPQYAKVDDQKLWNAFKQKYPTSLKQLRAAYPQYAKVDQTKFLAAIKEKYFADDSADEFIDRINPPNSSVGSIYHQIAEQVPHIISGWLGGTGELGRFPERAQNALNQAVVALGIDQKPMLTNDQQLVQKRLEQLGYKQSGELTPVAKGLLAGIVDPKVAQKLTGWAMKQDAARQKALQHVPKPQTITGQFAAKAFEGLGATPAIAPAFVGGSSAPALVLGMIYDGVQGEGKAREKGLDNSLMFGGEGASYRAVQQWLMYTPRGRVLSALLWAAGGMADQEAQALLTDPQGELKRAFTEPVNTAADLISTGAVNALFGSLASLGAQKFKADARASFDEAVQAREAGDYKSAAQLLDRTMLLLPEPVRKAATNNLLAWRNQAIEAQAGDSPLEMPGQRGFLTLRGTAPKAPDVYGTPTAGTEMRPQQLAPDVIQQPDTPPAEPTDEARQQQLIEEHFKRQELRRRLPSDAMTDEYYYSGIDLGKMYEDLAKRIKPVREFLVPEHETEPREAATAIIGENIGKMQRENQRMKDSWYRQQKLENEYRWGYEADQRRAFWASIKQPTAMKMFEQHEAGLSTGNKTADRFLELHDGLMRSVARLDEARGFRHALIDSYIPHVLKDPADLEKVSAEITRRGWGDPSFMHMRQIPTVEMLHALGIKLKTYNLEELDQIRIEQTNLAEMRAATLENFHAGELAFSRFDIAKMRKDNPELAAQYMSEVNLGPNAKVWRSPRATGEDDVHNTYWLHKDADFMLRRATDPVKWHPAAKAVVQTASAIKQRSVGLNLGLSLYHQVHILTIGAGDSVANAYSKTLSGTATLKDWGEALGDVFTVGGASQIRSLYSNQRLLNWYLAEGENRLLGMRTGKGPSDIKLGDLSPHDREMFALQQEGGFVPQISHERQIQFTRWLVAKRGRIPEKPGIDPTDLGYAIITARPYQRWLFGRVIPSLKMYSYNRAAIALLEAKPWLRRPQYAMQRKIALRAIAREVDDRYGEQNLRQSFEDPHLKAIGQAVLLSYSWKKSFLGVYGGAVHDLTQARIKDAPSRLGTNRMAYAVTYTALSAIKNLAIAALVGVGIKSLKDAFYPNIGYDKDGKTLARIKPPDWTTTEGAGAWYHIGEKGLVGGTLQMVNNSLMPELSTLYDLFVTGKDYYGTDIERSDNPNKNPVENWLDKKVDDLTFSLKQNAPFTVQTALRPGVEGKDVLMQFLGVPRAPAYAERSDLENRIINDYVQYDLKGSKTKNVGDQIQARREFRQALKDGDPETIESTRQKLQSLGVTDKSIKQIEKTKDESEAERLFSHMPAGDPKNPDKGTQSFYWRQMSPDEQEEFRPLLHKKLQGQLVSP